MISSMANQTKSIAESMQKGRGWDDSGFLRASVQYGASKAGGPSGRRRSSGAVVWLGFRD
jgi:hypothetical protein